MQKMSDRLFLPSGDSSPPPPPPLFTEAKKPLKRRKMIVYEDEDEEEINQVSLPMNIDDEETEEDEEVGNDAKPIGNVVRVSGEGESRRNHFKGFEADGIYYELEDTVLVCCEEHSINMKPIVAVIKDISATRDGRISVNGRSFYRPEIAKREDGGSWDSGEARELFYSFDEIEFRAESVMHKCQVHFILPNMVIPSCREHPGFIVQKAYDSKSKTLYPTLDYTELTLLVQKKIDRIPKWTFKLI